MKTLNLGALARYVTHTVSRFARHEGGDPQVCDPVRLSDAPGMPDPLCYTNSGALGLPSFTLQVAFNHAKCMTSPNPNRNATVLGHDGGRVGYVSYAVSPLFDRLYLFKIEIDEAFRRQRYGLAIIRYLVSHYQLPLTTIHELGKSHMFWAAARHMLAPLGCAITTISFSEMDQEGVRWRHLQPEIDRLEQMINQRFLAGEDYASAVGRGLA